MVYCRRFQDCSSFGVCSVARFHLIFGTVFPRGGGGTLIFYIYIGLADFLGVKILKFSIFGVFQENHYFLGVVSF